MKPTAPFFRRSLAASALSCLALIYTSGLAAAENKVAPRGAKAAAKAGGPSQTGPGGRAPHSRNAQDKKPGGPQAGSNGARKQKTSPTPNAAKISDAVGPDIHGNATTNFPREKTNGPTIPRSVVSVDGELGGGLYGEIKSKQPAGAPNQRTVSAVEGGDGKFGPETEVGLRNTGANTPPLKSVNPSTTPKNGTPTMEPGASSATGK